MNKFFLQRRIPAYRQAGASGGQFPIINFQIIFPPKEDLPSVDNFRIFKILFFVFKIVLQRRIPACRQAGASGGKILKKFYIFPFCILNCHFAFCIFNFAFLILKRF
jgi:hypothetical protein